MSNMLVLWSCGYHYFHPHQSVDDLRRELRNAGIGMDKGLLGGRPLAFMHQGVIRRRGNHHQALVQIAGDTISCLGLHHEVGP